MSTARPLHREPQQEPTAALEALRDALQRQVTEGKLRPDDPIERHLPGMIPGGDHITIRQLLNHAGRQVYDRAGGPPDSRTLNSGPPDSGAPGSTAAPGSAPAQAPGTALTLAPETTPTEVLDAPNGLDAESDAGRPRRRRFRSRLLLLVLAVILLASAGTGYWVVTQEDSAAAASESSAPAATAEVTRETISATETFEGTLGHGDALSVTAGEPGTITRTAGQDAEVTRGAELYRLDERPVTALLGAVPMYRDLRAGDSGPDVEQLEANLAALGYGGFTADDEFAWQTAEAVRAWQADIGAEETGEVARSDVVFVPEGGRVDTIHADAGGAVTPGSPVLDVTGTEQVVSLEADVADRDLLGVDAAVAVHLPGGQEVTGTVTATSVVQAPPSGGAEGAGGSGEEAAGAEDAVAEVGVTLDEPVDEALLGSPVDVVVDVDERADVLVVPVNALLALTGGGTGLEVVAEDGTTSLVPVETGLFADGKVEVEGEGIDEGTVVGVAGR